MQQTGKPSEWGCLFNQHAAFQGTITDAHKNTHAHTHIHTRACYAKEGNTNKGGNFPALDVSIRGTCTKELTHVRGGHDDCFQRCNPPWHDGYAPFRAFSSNINHQTMTCAPHWHIFSRLVFIHGHRGAHALRGGQDSKTT
eukprot:1160305-Pelagomonas_calceolata.AAC.5